MTWKDIIKEREDLTEKVIEALIPMYKDRAGVLSSNILGNIYEEDLEQSKLQYSMDKGDVKSLIEDIEFAANANEGKDYQKIKETLDKLERLI
tara:strand:- start:2738 stop:3016 length:279 start_codon:yes stop_codon:yes gene_type:complete